MKVLTVNGKNSLKDVVAANKMLMGHNVFNHQTLWSSQHHSFTENSADATVEMKYYLGFKTANCTPEFGEGLKNYLLGINKLSPLMHARRLARRFEMAKKYISPIAKGHRYSNIGGPGIGTHSFTVPPNNWQSDNARDLLCAIGTPLVAVADGKIGDRMGPISSDDPHMAGLRFYLEDKYGNQWYYAHASRIFVHAGDHVAQGERLALSGEANGVAHLHIACEHGNPMNLLPK